MAGRWHTAKFVQAPGGEGPPPPAREHTRDRYLRQGERKQGELELPDFEMILTLSLISRVCANFILLLNTLI